MIKYLGTFLFGVYIGQEYGNILPNVKHKTMDAFEHFKKTELYKDIYKLLEIKDK
jgi:hypothetical protein